MTTGCKRAKIIATGEVGTIIDYPTNNTVRIDIVESIEVNETTFIPTIKRKTVTVSSNEIITL